MLPSISIAYMWSLLLWINNIFDLKLSSVVTLKMWTYSDLKTQKLLYNVFLYKKNCKAFGLWLSFQFLFPFLPSSHHHLLPPSPPGLIHEAIYDIIGWERHPPTCPTTSLTALWIKLPPASYSTMCQQCESWFWENNWLVIGSGDMMSLQPCFCKFNKALQQTICNPTFCYINVYTLHTHYIHYLVWALLLALM